MVLNAFFLGARQPEKLFRIIFNATECGYFDEAWYIHRYPDASRSIRDPLYHFRARANERDPHPLFDTNWYRERHKHALCGAVPLDHYKANWLSGVFQPGPLFDPSFYSSCHKTRKHPDPFLDYICTGWIEGRQPNRLFNPTWYLACNPDVAERGIEPLKHFVEYGEKELRPPHPLFDTEWYRDENADLSPEQNALAHFLQHGSAEGRNPHPLFSNAWYAHHEPSLDARNGMVFHFLADGWSKGRDPHPLFNAEYYASTLGTSVLELGNPLLHYLDKRRNPGKPNAYFDDGWYLERYPDVRKAGVNPLVHFVKTGAKEGRDPSPHFSTQRYLDEYRDVDLSRMNPLAHFLHYGLKEGRNPLGSDRLFGRIDGRLLALKLLHTKFDAFMQSGRFLTFSPSPKPTLSIILITCGGGHHTFDCLQALQVCLGSALDYEIILFDNNSGGDAARLLLRLRGITLLRSAENLGFLRGANAASAQASGEFILFINNDAQVTFGAIDAAVALLRSQPSCGAVGAKLILPDGSLQEAGSLVWSDGSCHGYLRGRDPATFEANFRREVDYCSGAFLMTRRALFQRMGQFDEDYAPAYYEETDYCFRLREQGFRVIYDPEITVFHFEFASSESALASAQLQEKNRVRFRARHEPRLATHWSPSSKNVLAARHAGLPSLRILVVDDKVPRDEYGSGFPRARALINGLAQLGIFVTLFPTDERNQDWSAVRSALDPRIEVVCGLARSDVMAFIKDRCDYYDAYLVSRPHNIEDINNALDNEPEALFFRPLIYDSEAIFAEREIARRALIGKPFPKPEIDAMLRSECELARFAKTVFCVSENDCRLMRDHGIDGAHVLGHSVEETAGTRPFGDRSDILFVGAVYSDTTPNGDSIVWFLDEVLPLIQARLEAPTRFVMAGLNRSAAIKRHFGADIVALGCIDDLRPVYNNARICVAPTRFAAGVPHKVHEAAAHGVPIVTTPLLARQVGWHDREELLIGHDAASFAKACIELYQNQALWETLRAKALSAVRHDCSAAAFDASLRDLRDSIAKAAQRRAPTLDRAAGRG